MKRRNILASGMALVMPFFAAHAQNPTSTAGTIKDSGATTLSYGDSPSQSVDIYLPKGNCYAWVVLVHGDGVRRGHKATARGMTNKVARWNAKNIAVVSVNYRTLSEAPVETQLSDVREAISFLQRKASTLGLLGPMVLMGHSTGGHLVALAAAQAQTTTRAGTAPWAGTVILDSGALNVPQTMERARLPLFKATFGADPKRWTKLSPIHQTQAGVGPTMIVYSTVRADDAALQAQMYAQRLTGFGVRNVQLLGVHLRHSQIFEDLGVNNDYTRAIEDFMASVHPAFGRSLTR